MSEFFDTMHAAMTVGSVGLLITIVATDTFSDFEAQVIGLVFMLSAAIAMVGLFVIQLMDWRGDTPEVQP